MVTTQIGLLFKQAVVTFTCKSDMLYQNLEILRNMLNKTTANDVNLHPQFMSTALWAKPNKAPVTYIDIHEDNILSMGVFVLKPGMKLPLHNHPQMYGLLKVIAGSIKVTSYSLVSNRPLEDHPSTSSATITAEKDLDVVINSLSNCCVLDHHKGNLHEIESIDGPAAFLDILAPPYDTLIENNGLRKCSYFEVVKEISPKIFILQETNEPSSFWNDIHPYTGPPVIVS